MAKGVAVYLNGTLIGNAAIGSVISYKGQNYTVSAGLAGRGVATLANGGGGDSGGTSGSSGSSSGGSSGGGGGGGDPSKAFKDFYRYIGRPPNSKVIQQAVSGKMSMEEFKLLVQRKDSLNYMKSWMGKQDLADFRSVWDTFFPSVGPQKQDYLKFLRGPWNSQQIKEYIMKTPQFAKVYPGFWRSSYAVRENPALYRQYKDEYRNIFRQYTGRFADNRDLKYFFSSRITPEEFKSNYETVFAGDEAFAWTEGRQLSTLERQRALYGREQGAQILGKLASSYQVRKGYNEATQAKVGATRNNQDKVVLQGAF
jgi:hypothetical protein